MGVSVHSAKASARPTNGYLAALFPDQEFARLVVNPRRGSKLSFPTPDVAKGEPKWRAQVGVQDALYTKFGLEDLVGCTTVEMRRRPIPHVFPTKQVAALTGLFSKWAPAIYERILSEIEPPVQVLNKTSRLGWPVLGRPESKRDAVMHDIGRITREGVGWMEDAFIVMNIRLQAEARSKEREFLFCTRSGEVYADTVKEKDRMVKTPIGERVAGRTRLVFNLPTANLMTQCLDTAIHNVLLKYPAFHHDMYNKAAPTNMDGFRMFFDVKHFERATSGCVRERARILGGRYAQIAAVFDAAPFLCPSDDRKAFWLLWPDRDGGYSDQFASGNSAVAPVQKEIFTALYAEFAVRHFGIPQSLAISWVFGGGDHRLRIKNYGDDNVVAGDEGACKALFAFLKDYLSVELEDPPKFLGFLWRNEHWMLGARSYLEKTYLNEREPYSVFRKYPSFGWIEKRKVYQTYGDPFISQVIFPEEEKLLAIHGQPWNGIVRRADEEAVLASSMQGQTDHNWILGKDYLMSAEEKLKTGVFEGLTPEVTAPVILDLLDQHWRTRLKWQTKQAIPAGRS